MCDSRPAVLRVFFLLRVRLYEFEQIVCQHAAA